MHLAVDPDLAGLAHATNRPMIMARPNRSANEGGTMKLMIGKPDDTEIVLAEQVGGAWRPSPSLAADMATFLQGADPEQFEMWVEEPE
jgi:hypothetical protein